MNYINFEMASVQQTSLLYPLKEFYNSVKKLGNVLSVVVVNGKDMTTFAITTDSNISTSITDLETFVSGLSFESLNAKVHIENDYYYIILSPSDRELKMNFQTEFIDDYVKSNVEMIVSKAKNNMIQKTLEHKAISNDDYMIKQMTDKHKAELTNVIYQLNTLTDSVMRSDDIIFGSLSAVYRRHITVCKSPYGQFEYNCGKWSYTSYDIDACDRAFYSKAINTYCKMSVLPVLMTFDYTNSILIYK